MIHCKRIYDPPSPDNGMRFLVDRLWPRGIKKETALLDGWLKDVSPSHELRRWFNHDPARWEEVRRRYFLELDAAPDAWRDLAAAARVGDITLLFAARDEIHNNAVALRDYLNGKLEKRPKP